MALLFNKDFTETTADSHNYLPWATDTKIMLTTKGFIDDINEPNPQAHVSDTRKYTTSHLLRHHLHFFLEKGNFIDFRHNTSR